MATRRRGLDRDRPEQLVRTCDEFVARYQATPEIARRTFAIHQRLLLEECIRRNGLAPPDIQELTDEIAWGLETVEEMEEAVVIRRRLVEFATTHAGTEGQASLVHMENLAKDLFHLAPIIHEMT